MSQTRQYHSDHTSAALWNSGRTEDPSPRPAQRRRAVVLVGAGLAVMLAAGATTLALTGSPSLGTPAFAASSEQGGAVRLRIVDTSAAAQQMSAQLAARGLNVTVRTAPVSPQLVGTWLSVGGDATTERAVQDDVTAQALGWTDDITVPRSVSGLVLTIGVAADPGDGSQVVGMRNAFAPGGSLQCSPARGASLAQARQVLAGQGYSVRTVAFGSMEPTAAADDDVVTTAFHTDAASRDLMLVATRPDDAQHLRPRLDYGFSPTQAAHPGCY